MTSIHADILNALDEMQKSPVYALRRRDLLAAENCISTQEEEIARLRAWKSEALPLLTQYDDIAESVGCPLGASKVDNLAKAVARLREVNAKLLAALEAFEDEFYERFADMAADIQEGGTMNTEAHAKLSNALAAIAAAKELTPLPPDAGQFLSNWSTEE